MAKKAIDIIKVSTSFDGQPVFANLSASIPAGGFTVFIGPNGAGKTTLMHCIVGEVEYSGEICFAESTPKRIGYVPQLLSCDAQTPITCNEFLTLSQSRKPLWLGLNKKQLQDNAAMLARVGLANFGSSRLNELSGGQLRRLLLAASLLRKPTLLLLDEPAAGVDIKGEHLFWELLNAIRLQENVTIVMVSHNLELISKYATHILCLYNGKCLEGTPKEVLTPEHIMTVFGIPITLCMRKEHALYNSSKAQSQ